MTTVPSHEWSQPTAPEDIARRAAGRRHYNSVRRARMELRRLQIATLLGERGWTLWGDATKVAAELRVGQSTARRDIAYLRRSQWEPRTKRQMVAAWLAERECEARVEAELAGTVAVRS